MRCRTCLSHTGRTPFCSSSLVFLRPATGSPTHSLRRTLLCSAVRIQAREYVQSRGQRVGKACKGDAAPLAVKGERTETRALRGSGALGDGDLMSRGMKSMATKSCNVFLQFSGLSHRLFTFGSAWTLGLRTVWRTPSPACAAVMSTCGCCYALMHLGCVAVLAVVRLHGVVDEHIVPVWNGKCAFSSPKLSRPPHTHTTTLTRHLHPTHSNAQPMVDRSLRSHGELHERRSGDCPSHPTLPFVVV